MIGATMATQSDDTWEFTQGMLMGSLDIDESYFINPKIKLCFYDAEDVLLDVVTGVRDLFSLDMAGVINFVNSIGAAFWKLGDVVEDCIPFTNALEKKQGGLLMGEEEEDFALKVIQGNMSMMATLA